MWSIFKVDFLPNFCMKNRPLETIKRIGFEKKQSSFSILCACAFLQELFYSKRSNEAEWWRKGSPLSWYKKLFYCSILKPIFSTLKADLEFECIFNGFSSKKPLSWCQKMRELCTLQEILAQLTYLITKKGFYVNRNPWGLERYSGLKMVIFSKIGQWTTTISTFFKLSKIKIHSAVDFCWQISSSRIFLQCLLPNQSSMFQDLSLILGSPLTGKLWRKSSLKAPNLMGWKKAQ